MNSSARPSGGLMRASTEHPRSSFPHPLAPASSPLNTSSLVAEGSTRATVTVFSLLFMKSTTILVPQPAVQQGAKGSFVWVINDKGEAEFRPVKVGPWHENQWFIDEGLQGGETVVVQGALKLRAGVPVEIVEHESKDKDDSAGQAS